MGCYILFYYVMLVMLRICDLNSLALDINNVASKQDWGCVVSSYMENTPGSKPVGCMPSLKKRERNVVPNQMWIHLLW